jgi:hypothetical protein
MVAFSVRARHRKRCAEYLPDNRCQRDDGTLPSKDAL